MIPLKIKEVSEKYNLTPDTLRYYERIGLISQVQRNKNGIREYTDENCASIAFIKCMRSAGLPTEALELFQQGDASTQARLDILKEQRTLLKKRVLEMQATLKRLDTKIEGYEDKLARAEK